MRARMLLDAACATLVVAACALLGRAAYTVDRKPAEPFDAILVPGCPSEVDGSPSRCQLGRAGHAALLWRQGWTRNFIVSGSDVHTPYMEAVAIAQAMALLGVPPARMVLERDALHSDENVYYGLAIARKLGWERLAVAASGPMASALCRMMVLWGHPCSAIPLEPDALSIFRPHEAALHALRAPRSPAWEGLATREARIARANGHDRPPSLFLYLFYRSLGPAHRPIAPEHEPITWEDWLLTHPQARAAR